MLIGRLILAGAGAAAVAGASLLGTPALAQGSMQDQMAVCARIGKKSARLECYDSLRGGSVQGSSNAGGFGAASVRAPSAPPPPPPVATPSFGAVQNAQPAAAQPSDANADEVNIAVVSSRDNGLSMWQFALADGAVWRMTERDTNFRPPAPNETVRIRKASLGSYLMYVGKQSSIRVERVR